MTAQVILGYDGWRVNVLDRDGAVCGAGVLVATDLVVTCAHVVAKALRTLPQPVPPAEAVTIGFPNATALGQRAATVDPDGWVPAQSDLSGDLALLRLDRPVDLEPATLADCGAPSDRSVRAFGHPGGDVLGRWAHARITGWAGGRNEWVQLNDDHAPGHRIEPGFSGAGVVEDGTYFVIGIIVGSDRAVAAKGAWMLAMEAIIARIPALGSYLRRRAPGSARLTAVQGHRQDHEDALVEALAVLDRLHRWSGRVELIEAVNQRLDSPLGVSAGQSAQDDLHAFIRACLDHPSGTAMRALADAMRDLYGDEPEVDHFLLLVAQEPGRRLTGQERDLLAALLGPLPDEQMLDALRVALGPLASEAEVDIRERRAVVDILVDHIGPRGAPPLLVLLKRLARRRPQPESDMLIDWLQRLAQRWQVPVEPVAVAAEGPAPAVPKRSYLVVELREDAPTPGGYLLSVLLQHDDGTGHALAMNDDQPLGLQEIPGHVGAHLRRMLHGIAPIGDMTIEFVLPAELLSHEVDQFEVFLDEGLNRLGTAYPVVVRSADRMRRSLVRRRWELRSRWLRDNGPEHHPDAITWVPLPAGINPNLEHRLRERDGYSDERPVCLVFTWRGQASLTRVVPRALEEALELGMPALLWCRNARLVDQFAAEMANQLNGLAVTELAARVHRLRQVADGRPEHIGSHVCLLWDDPQRLLPDQGLSAPA